MGIGAGPEAKSNASFVSFPGMVTEGHIQLPLNPWVFGPMPLDESEERAVRGAVTEDRCHHVSLRQVIAGRPEPLIEICIVSLEHRVEVDALEISTPFEEEVEQVPAPGSKRQVERCIPLEIKPVATPQQEGRERVLAGFERDLQRCFRAGSLREGLWRQLKRFP